VLKANFILWNKKNTIVKQWELNKYSKTIVKHNTPAQAMLYGISLTEDDLEKKHKSEL
jgi:hypothetical protein